MPTSILNNDKSYPTSGGALQHTCLGRDIVRSFETTTALRSLRFVLMLIACSSLLIGASLYIVERPDSHVACEFYEFTGFSFEKKLFVLCQFKWVAFSLPQGLWSFSGMLLLGVIWSDKHSRLASFWLAVFCISCLIFEPLQWGQFIPGTADLMDLLFALAGLWGGYAVVKKMKGIVIS